MTISQARALLAAKSLVKQARNKLEKVASQAGEPLRSQLIYLECGLHAEMWKSHDLFKEASERRKRKK